MMPSIADEIIIRSIQKTATPEEREVLDYWLQEKEGNIAYYCQLEEIWNARKNLPGEIIQSGWQMLAEEIISRPQKKQPSLIPVKKRRLEWLRYAAAMTMGILIASVLWITLSDGSRESRHQLHVQNVVYNKTGVHPVVLPDQSAVWMNEETRMTYPEKFTGETRLVTLEGKAYFDIRENPERPFIVQIGKMEIEVTGTEFFVESTPEEESIITLISGTVNLNYNDASGKKQLTSLTPGEQARLNLLGGKVKIENIDTSYYIAWKDGTYRFTDEPLEIIVSMLAKRFNTDVYIAPSLRNKRFTGRVVPGEKIEDILNSIGKSHPIKYRITRERINIIE